MSPERHIARIEKELHKISEHRHLYDDKDALTKFADMQLALYELQKVLEKGKDYESTES